MKRLALTRLDGYLPQNMEREYRLYYLKDDLRTASISMLFLTILLVIFAYNDYVLFGLLRPSNISSRCEAYIWFLTSG